MIYNSHNECFHNCRLFSRNKFINTFVERSGTPLETTNVRSRREETEGCCVARHRRCVADLATSLPYLYEVLGGKSDTLDA